MYDTEALSALAQVEQAAGPLWTHIDDISTLFAEYSENAHDDVASHLKAMRRAYASSLQFFRRLQEFQRTTRDRVEQFAQKFRRFENHISRTALNYGLNLLPDEMLSEIFVFAGTALNEKVALSLVCKRFRRVMMSMRKMWDGYRIETNQTPEQIMSIAEGSGFVSLKARFHSPCYVSTMANGLDDEEFEMRYHEFEMRYHKFAVGLILSFEPEELEILCWEITTRDWKEIEPILAGRNMQNLRSLMMPEVSQNSAGARLLTKWHMPLLRNLKVDFAPGAVLGRTLVQCSLGNECFDGIGEDEIDSLREFLATARSLQDLRLYLCPTARFYEVCDLPSLRSLHVNFEPHPSLARHLVRFRLFLPSHRAVSLSRMLDFLSSSGALQELSVEGLRGCSEDLGTTDPSVVTMPNVVAFELVDDEMDPTLVAKLRMPMLRTLKLRPSRLGDLSTMINEFRTFLQSMSSLEDLELNTVMFVDAVEIVRYAPPHLESFSLVGFIGFKKSGAGWNTSPVPRRKLIRFVYCGGFFPEFLPDIVDYLRAVDLGGIKLQFSDCDGCRDGTFVLDDVMSARIDT